MLEANIVAAGDSRLWKDDAKCTDEAFFFSLKLDYEYQPLVCSITRDKFIYKSVILKDMYKPCVWT